MTLFDLLTAKQVIEIGNLITEIDKRLTDLEKKIENMENAYQADYDDEIEQHLEHWNNS